MTLDLSEVFAKFPVLETERLRLREPKDEDAQAHFENFNDPKVLEYFGVLAFTSIDRAQQRVRDLQEAFLAKKGIRWSLELKQTGEMIGSCGFWRIDSRHHRAEIGYELGSRFHRKGYMTEAISAILDFGFNAMNLHTIEAHIHPENAASRATLLKMEFQQESLTRESFYDEYLGEFTDDAGFGLLKSEWFSGRP